MSQGVIFWNSGTKLLVRLTVALYTLRKHYSGPVCVILNDDVPDEYGVIIDKYGVDTRDVSVERGHVHALLGKTCLAEWTPYDTSVFLDCDTVTLKPFPELFQWAEDKGLVVAQFAEMNVKRNSIAKRVTQWRTLECITQEQYELAREYPRGINIGVLAFRRDIGIWDEWRALARTGAAKQAFIPDEVSFQVLLPTWEHHLAPRSFNEACNRLPLTDDSRILHYHGRKHCHQEKTKGLAQIWIDAAREMYRTNEFDFRTVLERWPYRSEAKIIREGL